jgi:hypothetical protein
MENNTLNWIANFIWGIADDVLRDLYVRGKYRDVILQMTVLRRFDSLLEPTKQAVLDMKVFPRQGGHHPSGSGAEAGSRTGLLQHLTVHAARSQSPRQPTAAQGRLRGIPGRLLAERAGMDPYSQILAGSPTCRLSTCGECLSRWSRVHCEVAAITQA